MIPDAAVIWDVDGTLVDTAELHFQAWQEITRQHQRPFTRADFATTFGRRNPEIIRQIFGAHLTDDQVAQLAAVKEAHYQAAARHGVSLLPGADELLAQVHAAGIKQAIGSSAPRANLDLILGLTNSRHFFDVIISMEDTQRGKPDPQVFQVAADRLDVTPSHCLVMEDAVAGVQAARAGGMKCIAVRFVGHHSAAALLEAGANRVVRSLQEVSVAMIREILAL